MHFVGLTGVSVRGFRSIKQLMFRPGPLSALVGEASAGKSNLLAAIRALLDPVSAPITASDFASNSGDSIRISAELGDGSSLALEASPPGLPTPTPGAVPPALFLPASMRSDRVVAPLTHPDPQVRRAMEILGGVIPSLTEQQQPSPPRAATEAARGLVEGLESCCRAGISGLVVLIEEPELFLPPQTQRYLYRLLRQLSSAGNQVLYSTHSPAFLNVTRLEELVFIERRPRFGTRVIQPQSLPADEEFRAYSEFDVARGELFLARAAILVEGLTEKLALPFVFHALGHDPDRERISIVECGGKANIPLIARISGTVGVPFIAVHDRDAPANKTPSHAEGDLNDLIGRLAGTDGRVELVPDFEAVAGLKGRRRKPARAWRSFARLAPEEVPEPLAQLVERAVGLARR